MEIKQINKILKTIKLPKDFKDLHNAKDLFEFVEATKTISTYLANYESEFINSFVMTKDEVLAYIPEKDYDKYDVCTDYLQFVTPRIILIPITLYDSNKDVKNFIDKNIDKFSKDDKFYKMNNHSIGMYVSKYCDIENKFISFECKPPDNLIDKLNLIRSNEKIFLVDTKNKVVHILQDKYGQNYECSTISGTYKTKQYLIIEDNYIQHFKIFVRRDYSLPAFKNDVYSYKTTEIKAKHMFCLYTNRYVETKVNLPDEKLASGYCTDENTSLVITRNFNKYLK